MALLTALLAGGLLLDGWAHSHGEVDQSFFTRGTRCSTAPWGSTVSRCSALILEGILIAGAVLLLVRRWNVPLGVLTLLLAGFVLAMALQTDLYIYAIAGIVTGVAADVAVATLARAFARGKRVLRVRLLLGGPLLASAAGLFLAYCFDSPIEAPKPSEA